jgi:glycosyltransferase involved in cell wall biosynthesis
MRFTKHLPMQPNFIVPNLLPSPSDPHAVALDRSGKLRKYFSGSHRPIKGIAPERQVRQPAFMCANVIAGRTLSLYRYECARFALSPVFEKWVMGQSQEGDHLIAGLGYFNRLAPRIQSAGGKVFLDARNSHPSSFWSLVAEEHARWDCPLPPIWPQHHLRQQRSVALADYVFAPSRFVADSFVERGFPAEKVLRLSYPVDLSLFKPTESARPHERPLTICSSGLLTLRKGSPYLFEAFKLIRKEVPNARLKLIRKISSNFQPVFERQGYDRLDVEWSPKLPHAELTHWLKSSDIFLLPTIEEGMVRSAAEALGCGLPVITTRNAGVDDFIQEGVNGSIVPIRDPQAIANAVLRWWERIQSGQYNPASAALDRNAIGLSAFERTLAKHLTNLGL